MMITTSVYVGAVLGQHIKQVKIAQNLCRHLFKKQK